MGKSKLIFNVCLVVLNVLLAIDLIVAIILRQCVKGTDNALYLSAIFYLVFSVLQLLAILLLKAPKKYILSLTFLLPKIGAMVFCEIVCDIAIKHTSDYVRNVSDSVVIICFFVLTALLFIAESAYCIMNLIKHKQ